jgi:hypothetical protein
MSEINRKLYIDSKTLSDKLDKVIINESKKLKKNLKRSNDVSINNISLSYA